MQISILRETLLEPLQMMIGVVERKQALVILSHALITVEGNRFSILTTDSEVELISSAHLETPIASSEPIIFTVPAHKLLDICKMVPEKTALTLTLNDAQLTLTANRSRFVLATLPAESFPRFENTLSEETPYALEQLTLGTLLQHTCFAMAQQEGRHHLTGTLFEIQNNQLRAVTTDGHRFAMKTLPLNNPQTLPVSQITLPRKGVLELMKLLKIDTTAPLTMSIAENHIRFTAPHFTFTSKLIGGKYPSYARLLPQTPGVTICMEGGLLREALLRVAILSNERLRVVMLRLTPDCMHISANNSNKEEAEETIALEYTGEELEAAFNVAYLLDVLNIISGPIRLTFLPPKNRMMIQVEDNEADMFIVMPLQV